jgi:hypothetical protein
MSELRSAAPIGDGSSSRGGDGCLHVGSVGTARGGPRACHRPGEVRPPPPGPAPAGDPSTDPGPGRVLVRVRVESPAGPPVSGLSPAGLTPSGSSARWRGTSSSPARETTRELSEATVRLTRFNGPGVVRAPSLSG